MQRGVLGDFTDALVTRTKALRLGDGLEEGVDVGPIINETQLRRIHEYTGIGVDEGARLLAGGEVAQDGELAQGFFYTPTVFADVTSSMRIAQEEIFGPTTAILPVDSLDEALAAANSTQFGLSLSIYTNDLRHAFRAIHELESGIVYVNAPTIGAEIQLPFGGTKNTGNGHREAGGHVLDEFSEWKSIYIDYSGRLQRAQIDTDAPVGPAVAQLEERFIAHAGGTRAVPGRWRRSATGAVPRLPRLGGELRDLVRRAGAHPHPGDPRPARLRRVVTAA